MEWAFKVILKPQSSFSSAWIGPILSLWKGTILSLLTLVLCGFCSNLAFGQAIPQDQADKKPFETIRIGGFASTPLSTRNLDAWTSTYGPGLRVATPFFVGELGLMFAMIDWTSLEENVPDFSSTLIMADWSVFSSSQNKVKLGAGLRFGNFFMSFKSLQLAGERNESEVMLSPFVKARRTVLKQVEVFGELSAARVFTQPYVDLLQVSAGLSVTIGAPSWLKEVLR